MIENISYINFNKRKAGVTILISSYVVDFRENKITTDGEGD